MSSQAVTSLALLPPTNTLCHPLSSPALPSPQHCTAALCRRMDWREASLWPHSLPPPGRCILALSGGTPILNPSAACQQCCDLT